MTKQPNSEILLPDSTATENKHGKQADTSPAEEYPLVTFALFAYNQEKYIREAVEGAFTQTYEPLEIILSDDCSQDKTFEIMQAMVDQYMGPHKITIRRPPSNLGLAKGISDVCKAAAGKLIVVAAGDDISSPNRTKEIVHVWNQNGRSSGSLYSHFRTISTSGIVSPPDSRAKGYSTTLKDRRLDMLNNFSGISGCTQAWTRDIFDFFGPIDNRIHHEDVIIPLRALLIGSISFIPLDLVDYRLTPGSMSRNSYKNAADRINKMRNYWAGQIAIFEQFKSDVQLALKNGGIQKDDISWILDKVAQGEEHARLILKLHSSNSAERLKTIFIKSNKISLKQRVKWLTITLIPWLYGINAVRTS